MSAYLYFLDLHFILEQKTKLDVPPVLSDAVKVFLVNFFPRIEKNKGQNLLQPFWRCWILKNKPIVRSLGLYLIFF